MGGLLTEMDLRVWAQWELAWRIGVVFPVQTATEVAPDRRFRETWLPRVASGQTATEGVATLGCEARPLSGSGPEASFLDRDKRSQKENRLVLLEVVLAEDRQRLAGRVRDRSRSQRESRRLIPDAVSDGRSSEDRARLGVQALAWSAV